MAVNVLQISNEDNLIEKSSRCLAKRHYKKDSRFVLDLYTLTYDSHESLDSLGDLSTRRIDTNITPSGEITDKVTIPKNYNSPTKNRPSQRSRLHNGKSLRSPFLWPPFINIEDNQFEEEAYSLPIFNSKPLLNFADNTSLPIENPQDVTRPYFVDKLQESREQRDTNNNNTSKNIDTKVPVNTEIKKETISPHVRKDPTRWLQELQNEVCSSLKKVYSNTDKQPLTRSNSSVTSSIKTSLKKVGFDNWNKSDKTLHMNGSMLNKMDSNQLKIIIDDLHGQVEKLNDMLMKMLTERDELHTNRDTLLNHVKDITAYLDLKGFEKLNLKNCLLNANFIKNNIRDPSISSICAKKIISGLRFNRLASYIKN